MLLTVGGLQEYVSRVAELLERFGVVLDLEQDADLELAESPIGATSFEILGFLPDGRVPPLSVVAVRELWRPAGPDKLERWEYEYELLDRERGFRRAFHLHDRDTFIRRFQVVVHEHCERPVEIAPCPHIYGSPVLDGYQGVELLLSVWTDPDAPDCAQLRCLG